MILSEFFVEADTQSVVDRMTKCSFGRAPHRSCSLVVAKGKAVGSATFLMIADRQVTLSGDTLSVKRRKKPKNAEKARNSMKDVNFLKRTT